MTSGVRGTESNFNDVREADAPLHMQENGADGDAGDKRVDKVRIAEGS